MTWLDVDSTLQRLNFGALDRIESIIGSVLPFLAAYETIRLSTTPVGDMGSLWYEKQPANLDIFLFISMSL